MGRWLRLGVLARRRSHRKMFTVVTFMSPPASYITIQTCLHLYRQKLLKFGWFDVMWQETPRVEIRPCRKSWDRAEMAQTGQNYQYFPKRAENQNDQNLMVVWWYRSVFGDRTSFRAKGLRRTRANRNFTLVFGDRTSFRAKGLRRTRANRNFTLVFGDRTSFRATGLRRKRANRNFNQSFWRSNIISFERVAPDPWKSQVYHSFWRSNLASCERVAFRSVWLALPRALREKWTRRREQEGKRARGQERMWRWEEVKMWR